MKYTVTSDLVAWHASGDTVTDDDLEGANIAALVAGGHLTPVETKSRRKAQAESEAD